MNNNILERIIKDRRREELDRLSSVKIINNLFSGLMDRERDVLTKRFGLTGNRRETLERIGQYHNLTRERVRQIESASIRKIKKFEGLEKYIIDLKAVVNSLLDDHGGLIRRDFLLDILTVLSLEWADNWEGNNLDGKHRMVHKNNFDFILSRILDDEFEFIFKSDKFNPAIKSKLAEINYLEDLADDLLTKIDGLKKTLNTEELVDLLKKLDSYNRHQGRISGDNSTDVFSVYKSLTFDDKAEIINNNKILYSLIQAIKNLEKNKYGHWGKSDWQEIKPKTINDKIYLVLKNNGQPMHFTKIADKINEIKFDHKKANAATVHNELILDDRYVLVGRGTYGLRAWQK